MEKKVSRKKENLEKALNKLDEAVKENLGLEIDESLGRFINLVKKIFE